MQPTADFEDMLEILNRREVRYLIIGGLAFIFHAKPRYTKDLDIWIDPDPENVARANAALDDFGCPYRLDPAKRDDVVLIGIQPNRIDLLLNPNGMEFQEAWPKRVVAPFGGVTTNWIDIDSLIAIKSRIPDPRHQEDVRVLREVKKRQAGEERSR